MIGTVSFLDGPTPIAFAHRGFAPDGAENSMSAFQRAVALGYRYLETDVRATADGVAVAFHDASLRRMTGRAVRIDQLPWEQVRRERILGREPIPLLADVLTTWPQVRVNIDVKSAVTIRPVIDVIKRTGTSDRVCVGAFSARRITAVRRELGPGLCTAFGPGAVVSLRVSRHARARGATCVQAPARINNRPFVTSGFIARVHSLGLQVHVYTVNDEAEMTRLLDLGVNGIMTDRADLLRDVLVRRGQWTSA